MTRTNGETKCQKGKKGEEIAATLFLPPVIDAVPGYSRERLADNF